MHFMSGPWKSEFWELAKMPISALTWLKFNSFQISKEITSTVLTVVEKED